ncbi:MAG: hypothetical protein ACJ75S_05840 [Solirubrobacterales bacterium]
MGGHRKHPSRSRPRAAFAGALAALLALSIGACGGGSSSDANEAAGTYQVKVTRAEFPTRQELGQTSLLRLGIRNEGRKTIPALTVSFSLAGQEGRASNLPFGIHDPEPGLAQPDRPVWVLAAHYPKLVASTEPGGAETSNPKTYDFGPLKPGATTDAIWKLSAVRSGRYALLYAIAAGLGGQAKADTAGGAAPGGSFAVRIGSATPNKVVNDAGEVVAAKPNPVGK